MTISVVILAAGAGKRMRSQLPKVLHEIGGRPLLGHAITTARQLADAGIHVVYGHGGDQVIARLSELLPPGTVQWVRQERQLGTGHAVAQALPAIDASATVVVLYGDVPLISAATLRSLVAAGATGALALMTVELDNPAGYGRIERDAAGAVTRIVEEKDASDAQRGIREINTGFLAVRAGQLRQWVERLDNSNAQGEFYLTDIIAMAAQDGVAIHTVSPASHVEVLGVNDKAQLALLERCYQKMRAQELLDNGVTLRDPARFDLRGEITHGTDVTIDVNVIVAGKVTLGSRVTIGPNVLLTDVEIGDDVEILANCVIEDAVIGAGCRIGPFARVRPQTRLADNVHVGNFVEIKKSTVAPDSKINHLSYIGDSTVGSRVNIGAGTITCNYDGANKYQTIIGDDVFVGSDSQLVAPVRIGDGATIGAGSTITRDAPAGELTLSRPPQQTHPGWKRPVKKKRLEE